ncbi:hypothetical protein [Winogradskyella sp.]|jgi:hypothetical protein|uniref:hypothetical protein n=1 Tax=Winogradskyella sp. TaxID=1883156 RepID=UPI0025CEA3CF|nr:hypothetical protein [Winogradskyella sp.]MCT4629601.1 hypothetical protein [Winogradskyella sp.]
MKNFFQVIILLLSITTIAQTSKFDIGYQKGYEEGYCYQDYGCIPPIPPISPLPTINESSNSYKDGYQRGFIDGRSVKKGNKSTANNYVNKPREYPEYVEPYDFNLLYKALEAKQKQYEAKKKSLTTYYKTEVKRVREEAFTYYNEAIEYASEHKDIIRDFKAFEIYVESLIPFKITEKYPDNLSYDQAEKLIKELITNSKKIKSLMEQANNVVNYYLDRPNNLIKGIYKTNKIADYEYNSESKEYDLSETLNEKSFIILYEHVIVYKRADSDKLVKRALRYEGIKNGAFAFYDGWENLIVIDRELKNVHVYHNANSDNTQYLNKTTYHDIIRERY